MKYRKIDPKIWNDEKFNDLSDNGKLAFFFLLTHPHMTPVGAMRGTFGGLAEELGWETEAFREAFSEALSKGMVKYNSKAHFIGLPNFMKYNSPESPNVVTAWAKCMDDIPECNEKTQIYSELKGLLKGFKEPFLKAFHRAFGNPPLKTMPNQEQEQEQEQELKRKSKKKKKTAPDETPKHPYREFVFLKPSEHDRLLSDFGKSQTDTMLDVLDNYIGANPKRRNKYTDHNRVLRGWVLEKYQEKAKTGGKKDGNEFSSKIYTGTPVENIQWLEGDLQ
jgi:hypothetical protein